MATSTAFGSYVDLIPGDLIEAIRNAAFEVGFFNSEAAISDDEIFERIAEAEGRAVVILTSESERLSSGKTLIWQFAIDQHNRRAGWLVFVRGAEISHWCSHAADRDALLTTIRAAA